MSRKFILSGLVVLGLGLAACSNEAPSVKPVAQVSAHQIVFTQATAITERQWALIAKDPAKHTGETVVIYGKVTQFDSATGTGTFRANVGGKKLPVSYGFVNYPSNVMISGDVGGLANLVEGDIFRGEVTVTGPYTYDTQIGGSTTVPALNMTGYQVIGHV